MGLNKHEPSSNARIAATALYDNFQGLVQAGFTEQQALALLGSMLAAAAAQNGNNE